MSYRADGAEYPAHLSDERVRTTEAGCTERAASASRATSGETRRAIQPVSFGTFDRWLKSIVMVSADQDFRQICSGMGKTFRGWRGPGAHRHARDVELEVPGGGVWGKWTRDFRNFRTGSIGCGEHDDSDGVVGRGDEPGRVSMAFSWASGISGVAPVPDGSTTPQIGHC